MIDSDRDDLDARLGDALRARTHSDADLDRLWVSIVRAAEVTRQRRSTRWPRHPVPGRTRLLVAAGALVAGSIGLASLMSGAPSPEPTPVNSRIGPIVVIGAGGWVSVDPAEGRAARTVGMGLISAPAMPIDVSWSPDGRRVAYANGADVVVVDRLTRRTTPIWRCAAAAGCGVAWSPDGRRIAVSTGGRIVAVDPDGSHPAELSAPVVGRSVAEPVWSPDGASIAYLDPIGLAIHVIRADGTDDHRVSAPSEHGTLEPQDLTWSADGTRVVFLGSDAWTEDASPSPGTGRAEPGWELRIMSVPVSAQGVAPTVVDVVGHCYCLGFWPSFAVAPDGSAYAVNTLAMPIPSAKPRDGLFVIDAASLSARYLGDFFDSTVTWQPQP